MDLLSISISIHLSKFDRKHTEHINIWVATVLTSLFHWLAFRFWYSAYSYLKYVPLMVLWLRGNNIERNLIHSLFWTAIEQWLCQLSVFMNNEKCCQYGYTSEAIPAWQQWPGILFKRVQICTFRVCKYGLRSPTNTRIRVHMTPADYEINKEFKPGYNHS